MRLHRVREGWRSFASRDAKLRYIASRAHDDAGHPLVREVAARFALLSRPAREAALLAFVQWCVEYIADPTIDDGDGKGPHHVQILDSAPVALERGFGKCTAKASLLCALCHTCDLPCELAPVFTGRYGFPHVRTAIRGLDGVWRIADPCILNARSGACRRAGRSRTPRISTRTRRAISMPHKPSLGHDPKWKEKARRDLHGDLTRRHRTTIRNLKAEIVKLKREGVAELKALRARCSEALKRPAGAKDWYAKQKALLLSLPGARKGTHEEFAAESSTPCESRSSPASPRSRRSSGRKKRPAELLRTKESTRTPSEAAGGRAA